QDYINTKIDDPEKQAKYEIALFAALNSPAPTLNPVAFALNNIEQNDRPSYLQHIGADGLAIHEFHKDTQLIKPQLTRIQMNFQSGISLLASPAVPNEKVELALQDDGTTKVSFEDKVTGLQGKR